MQEPSARSSRRRSRLLGMAAAAAVAVGSLLAVSPQPPVEALENGLAETPPMGWNSWNQFYCNGGNGLTAAALMGVADQIVEKGLDEVGYEYVVLDDCFQNGRDANGVLQVDPIRFPNGIKPVADYVHSKGLKFGIYSVPGTKTCANLYNGYTPNAGSYGHEQIDAETFAAWGVDYLKYDWCYPDSSLNLTKMQAFSKMRDELAKVDRDIVYAISEYGDSAPWTWAEPVANLWRTTGDIAPNWSSITSIIDRQAELHPYAGPGHWNDPDMLQFSNGSLTFAQNKSHLAMWSMLAAPLFLGTDVGALSDAEVALLTNQELVDIDQDPLGEQARRVSNGEGLQVWTRELADGDLAVALLNTTGSSATISTSLPALGAQEDLYVVRDVWSRTDLYNTAAAISATVPAYETAVYRLSPGMDEELPGVVGAAGSGRVEQGAGAEVSVAVHNLLDQPLLGAELRLDAAGGVTPQSPVAIPTIAAGGSGAVTVRVDADATASIGDVSLPAQVVWQGGSEPASVLVKVTPAAPVGETYLSDLPWLATTNGWNGNPRRDLSQDDRPLTVNGTVYPKGIGSNAVSTVDVWLGGNCTVLSGALGVDDETNNGNATLKPSISGSVTGDGRALWNNSSVIRYQQKESFTIDVTGVDRLRLTADIGGDSNAYDHADWLTMSLSCAEAEVPELGTTVSVELRCVAGKGVLAVRVENESEVPVGGMITGEYGAKSIAAIAPGMSASQVFSTRRAAVPAGSVLALLSGEVDGRTVTVEQDVAYPAKTC
ncbi:NPCBM/NEW2 domain-containing protein [Agromyces larvae]|uniref:Alpha-galactosidase n=1 Tax=Agromyces larvae TaxID=2929802 RepID=A0ABY4BXQ4_9MICO|nr:NPCBM/NEW2 domain-containing protein [Agromyces larvae]UOE44015.1 NPCBM/NEW2 domain-containing protein [Agromyces larvae]